MSVCGGIPSNDKVSIFSSFIFAVRQQIIINSCINYIDETDHASNFRGVELSVWFHIESGTFNVGSGRYIVYVLL